MFPSILRASLQWEMPLTCHTSCDLGLPTPPKLQDFFVRSPSEHKGCADKSQETWLHRVRDLPLCSLCPTRVVTNMNQQFLYDLWTWWLPSPGCLYFPLCWLALEFHWVEFQHYMIDDTSLVNQAKHKCKSTYFTWAKFMSIVNMNNHSGRVYTCE